MAYSGVVRTRAIEMRIEQRASIEEIHKALGVSQGALSLWLRQLPLTSDEQKSRQRTKNRARRKPRIATTSKFQTMVADRELSRAEKGRIAEAAVLFRLLLHGFTVFRPALDGGSVDWLAQAPGATSIHKVQVRWSALSPHSAQPSIRLKKFDGHRSTRRYNASECDFLVGYCLLSDTAYVYSVKELSHLKSLVTATPDAAERWDKLK